MEYRLDELFDLQMGKTPSRNNPGYWNSNDHKWISIGDLSKCGKYIYETKEYISELAVKDSGISIIPANTVIMSFKLSIGKTAITKEPMYSNEAIMSFRDLHKVDIVPDYLYYLLGSRDWNEGTNKAVMGKTLNKATLSQIRIRIHSISEQIKIVSVLDKINSIIESRQNELKALDELIKAQFIEMFGDPILCEKDENLSKLGDVCALKAGKFAKADDIKDTLAEGMYPCYGGNGLRGYVKDYNHDGEFPLIGRQGALCGNVQFATGKFHATEHAIVVTPKEEIDRFWLYHLLVMLKLNRYASGAAQPGLAVNKLEDIRVEVPPVQRQYQFSLFATQSDKSKAAVQQALDKAILLFDSLRQQYFV